MNIKALVITLLIVTTIGFLLQRDFIQKPISSFLNQNIPWSVSVFSYVKDNITSGTLMGLLIYLVFINIPVLPSTPAEAYVIFSFIKGANIFGIVFITSLVYMFFATVYYLIGYFYGQRMLEKILKRPVGYNPTLNRFIGPLLFLAFLLPIPFPIPIGTVLVLLGGFYRSPFTKVIAAVGVATLLRFIGILILYHSYTPLIDQYLTPVENLLKLG